MLLFGLPDPDTTPFNKTFTAQLRTLDELERRLRFLTEEIKDAEVPVSVLNLYIYLRILIVTTLTLIRFFLANDAVMQTPASSSTYRSDRSRRLASYSTSEVVQNS